MSVQRIGDQARFKVIVHDPIHLVDTGDRDADIEAGVRRINAFIEERVRARPDEWFWVHKRWPGAPPNTLWRTGRVLRDRKQTGPGHLVEVSSDWPRGGEQSYHSASQGGDRTRLSPGRRRARHRYRV